MTFRSVGILISTSLLSDSAPNTSEQDFKPKAEGLPVFESAAAWTVCFDLPFDVRGVPGRWFLIKHIHLL